MCEEYCLNVKRYSILHYPQGSGYGWETLTPNANPLSKICLKNLYFPYFSPCAKLEWNYYSLLIKFVFLKE